jgi:Type III restriction enzyme, res subunit/Helicase conserved C-terminal domain
LCYNEKRMENSKKIFVQKSDLLNGVLRYSSLDESFNSTFDIDSWGTLRNRDRIDEFNRIAKEKGYELIFENEHAKSRYENLINCSHLEYEVNSPFLVDNHLFPFQHIGLNYVWEQMHSDNPCVLVQWDTGAGKTLLSCLTAQKLFDNGDIDMVLVFSKKIKQYDWEQEFKRMTTLNVQRITEKMTRKKRHEFYKNTDAQVITLNYEKVREGNLVKVKGQRRRSRSYDKTDILQILEMIDGKRTLIIIDEAQKINAGESLLSSGFTRLINTPTSETKTLALTATPYTTSPLNIRNIFSAIAPGIPGVSDMSRDIFKTTYGKDFSFYNNGYVQEIYVKEWDRSKLPLLGKKHEDWTHIAMKSDPTIASQFPESMPKRIVYELSDVDREIYEWAENRARERYNPDNAVANWSAIDTLRMICNTTAGLRNSEGKFAKEIVAEFDDMISIENSAKYQLIESNIEYYLENSEKCVLFTFWTNGTLFPYYEILKEKFGKEMPILPIWGVGMDTDTAAKNIATFNSTKGPAILITSDVLQEGANLYAPYLWNVEIPRTYADYKQRKDRINRADSKSKGISHTWVYRSVAVDTIEERVDSKILRRRAEAQAIRGVLDEHANMEDTVDVTAKSLLF